MIDWVRVFDELEPRPGATDAEIEALLAGLREGLTEAEVRALRGDGVDPASWTFPTRPLPPAYAELLRYSNGGSFRAGTRSFDELLATRAIRPKLLELRLPETMPRAFPFACEGDAGLYAFDMREPAREGEYPVLFCTAGSHDYDEALLAGSTFLEACGGVVDPPQL